MFEKSLTEKQTVYSSLLLVVALIAALYFSGAERYLLSLCWLALMLWGVYLFSLNEKLKISIDVTTLVILFFVLWMLLSLYWHPALGRGIYINWVIGIFFFVLLVTAYLIQEQDIRVTLNLLLVVGCFIGFLSLYQSLIANTQPAGLFLNKNNNAAFLNLFVLPLMSVVLFKKNHGASRWLIFIAFVSLLLAVLQVASRGAFIGLGMASLILLVFAIKMRRTKGLVLLGILVMVALLLNSLISTASLKTDLQSMSRWYLYSSTIEMIRDASWYGAGNGMWRLLYPAYRNPDELSAGSFVHNDYLQILYELGLPGFTLLFLFAVMLTQKVYLLVKHERDLDSVALYLGLFAAITAVAIHSLVTFNFYKVSILTVLGVYSGLILRRTLQLNLYRSYTFSIEVTRKRVFVFLLLMIASGKSIILPGIADAYASGLVDTEFYDRSPLERIRIYNRLRQLDPDSYRYPLLAANEYAAFGEGKPFSQRSDIYSHSRELLREAKQLNSFKTNMYIAEAALLRNYRDVVGDVWNGGATSLVTKALVLNPRDFWNNVFLAKLLEERGDKEKALEVLLKWHDHPYNNIKEYHAYGKELAAEVGNRYAEKRFSSFLERDETEGLN